FWVVAATIFSLWPGLFTSTWSADYAGVSRSTFEIYTLVTVAFLLAVADVFWAVGRGRAIHTGPLLAAGPMAQAAPATGDCFPSSVRKRGDRQPRSPRLLFERSLLAPCSQDRDRARRCQRSSPVPGA